MVGGAEAFAVLFGKVYFGDEATPLSRVVSLYAFASSKGQTRTNHSQMSGVVSGSSASFPP